MGGRIASCLPINVVGDITSANLCIDYEASLVHQDETERCDQLWMESTLLLIRIDQMMSNFEVLFEELANTKHIRNVILGSY